jgi:hypothetical protein
MFGAYMQLPLQQVGMSLRFVHAPHKLMNEVGDEQSETHNSQALPL